MPRKGIDWQEKTVKLADFAKSGDIYYWQNPDFNSKSPTLLFVHGFRGDHHGLQFIADEFLSKDQRDETDQNSKNTPKYNIILLDLPAYGKSAEFNDANNHTAAHYADFLKAFIDKIDLKTKPILLSHSFGTTIVSRFLAKYSDAVDRRVILLAPIAKRVQSRGGHKFADAVTNAIAKLPEKITYPIASSQLLSDFVSWQHSTTGDRRIYEDITKDQHRKYFGKFSSVSAMLGGMKSAYTDSFTDLVVDLSKLDKNWLIIVGDKDKMVEIEDARWLNAQLGGHIVELRAVGHLLHYEAYAEVVRAIKEFLK
jgi:pimeloyl-ACP methyl ester carboxylesterase